MVIYGGIKVNNNICNFCKSKHTWDCEEGYIGPCNCNSFCLDWETLSNKHKEMFIKIIDMIFNEKST